MAPRSTSRSISDPEPGVVVGIVGAPHGVRGDVRVQLLTDVTDRFRAGATLDCDGIGPLTIESVRATPRGPLVRFNGYRDRPAAERLRGKALRVSIDEARRATAGAWLWSDLVGLAAVTPTGEALGTVHDVIRAGSADVLVVLDDAGRERLMPALASVVREVDLKGKRIVLQPQQEG